MEKTKTKKKNNNNKKNKNNKKKKKKKKKTNNNNNNNTMDSNRRLGVKTERSGVPHRESKPSAHRHRTARIARTTRQINGAIHFRG